MSDHRSNPLKIAIIYREELILEGLAALFRSLRKFQVVSVGRTWHLIEREALHAKPEVVLVDVGGNSMTSWVGIHHCKERLLDARIVLIDDAVRTLSLQRTINLGLAGYLLKTDSVDEITAALLHCHEPGKGFSQAVAKWLVQTPSKTQIKVDPNQPGLHLLSRREIEVLGCIAAGLPMPACSQKLGISTSTLDNHKSRIMKKLRRRRMVDLVILAIHEGVVGLPSDGPPPAKP